MKRFPTPMPEPPRPDAIDAELDAMLDAALAPAEWSDASRASTLQAMREASAQGEAPAVAGRVGFGGTGVSRFGLGLAAAAALALSAAVVVVTLSSDRGTPAGTGLVVTQETGSPNAGSTNGSALANNGDPSGDRGVNDLDLDAQLAAELDAWSSVARDAGLGLDADAASSALASADWWESDPSVDAYDTDFDADAFRRELDAFAGSSDAIF